MIHFRAFILALIVGGFLTYPDIVAIGQSTISTAAIGYIFLPFGVAPAIILVLLVYYCAIFSSRKFMVGKKRIGVLYGVLSFIFILYSGFYLNKEYAKPFFDSKTVAAVIAPISHMNHTLIDQLITRYPSLPESGNQRIFILNALLERNDLNAVELDKIARIQDPSIHDKLYSRYGLLGKNRKGLSVARLVALHPNVDSSTLSFLGEMNEPYLQGSVAGNPKTPAASLEALYQKSKNNKDGYLIQWGLVHNKHTPVAILKELSLSSDRYTKRGAEETLKSVK
ncbi:MAG: hypothetical protein IPP74_02350 [Alphaproteobacteria bacterium]|nr:hypothetical protein [Alphaproteobacteria bacterium]